MDSSEQKQLDENDIAKITFAMALNRYPGDMGRGLNADSRAGAELARNLLADFDKRYFKAKSRKKAADQA